MKLSVWRASPAGNVTLLVKSFVPRDKYAGTANALLAKKELAAEQVAFITAPKMGGVGRIEMMGGEFCGNAARSFGFLCAMQDVKRPQSVLIEVSGVKEPLEVTVNLKDGESFAQMPLPKGLAWLEFEGEMLCAVQFEGITHVIVQGAPRDEQSFVLPLAKSIIEGFGAQASGVMFLQEWRLTPAVYVKETGSLVWEGSCGSGSSACAAFLSRQISDGEASCLLEQPGGSISVLVKKAGGAITDIAMGGPVSISELIEVEL